MNSMDEIPTLSDTDFDDQTSLKLSSENIGILLQQKTTLDENNLAEGSIVFAYEFMILMNLN